MYSLGKKDNLWKNGNSNKCCANRLCMQNKCCRSWSSLHVYNIERPLVLYSKWKCESAKKTFKTPNSILYSKDMRYRKLLYLRRTPPLSPIYHSPLFTFKQTSFMVSKGPLVNPARCAAALSMSRGLLVVLHSRWASAAQNVTSKRCSTDI